jgi:uncharacterized protein YukE
VSSRNYLQWELVGEGSDPVPASEQDLRDVAKVFTQQGNEMNDAASLLREIANLSGWKGESATEFADKAEEGYGDLDKAADKYTGAGTALSKFAGAVGTARDETQGAVDDAVKAEAARKANTHSLLDGVDDPTDEQKDADEKRGKRLEAANTALTAARTRLENAMEALDTAASTCASAIKNASGKFKDSKMDDIKGFVKSALGVIVDALNVLAVILAVVIIVLLIIGTGGAFLAFLMTAAMWVGFAILAGTAIQYAMGDASGEDLAWAVVGAFGGKLLSKAGKAAVTSLNAAKSMQVARITQATKDGMAPWIKFGKKIPFARVLPDFLEARAVNRAVSAFEGQMTQLTSTSRLLAGFELKGLRTTANQINALRGMNPTPAMTAALNSAVRFNSLAGVAGVGTVASQIRDMAGFGESVTNTIHNVDAGIDYLQNHPPAIQPIGIHVTGAGR